MAAFDVIVVGSGAAGLTAAWHAATAGATVLVVNKGMAGRTGATITSGGGVSVAGESLRARGFDGDPTDREEDFFRDTVTAGQFLGDQTLVQAMVTEVGPEVRRLADLGVPVQVMRRAPGHSSGRGVRVTGPDLQRGLLQQAVSAGVKFLENYQLTGLLQDRDGQVVGVAGLDRAAGEVRFLDAKAVILAHGGATALWPLRTAPEELTGDGHAAALAAGASLIDMEMLQFLPCCLLAPDIWRGLQFPWILGPQAGIRAWLLNKYGERFMARWDSERMELSTRDQVAFGSAFEAMEGRGSPAGGVYLSWAHLPRDILDNAPRFIPAISADWRWEGFDMRPLVERIRAGHAVEVAPAAHFSIGGIRIDAATETGVPGLFACGEATGGLHGGNRLSGNAGAQVLVQGRRAGLAAAARARENPAPAPAVNRDALRAQAEAPLRNRGDIAAHEVKSRLSRLSERALGPIRDQSTLTAAQRELRSLMTNDLPALAARGWRREWNRDWGEALECTAAATVLDAVLTGASARTHSLGAHRRRDADTPPVTPLHGILRRGADRAEHRFVPVALPFLSPATETVR